MAIDCRVVVLTRGRWAGGGVAGFSAEQVEEVRMVIRMLPVFVTTILYWTIYAQASPALR